MLYVSDMSYMSQKTLLNDTNLFYYFQITKSTLFPIQIPICFFPSIIFKMFQIFDIIPIFISETKKSRASTLKAWAREIMI